MSSGDHKLLYLPPDEGPQIRTQAAEAGAPGAMSLHVMPHAARFSGARPPKPIAHSRNPVVVHVYNWRDQDGDVPPTLQRLANAMGAADLLEALSATLHRHGQEHLIDEARARMQHSYRERHDHLSHGNEPHELWGRVRTEDD